MLDDNGLLACGSTMLRRDDFGPDKFKGTCEIYRALGCPLLCATRCYFPPADNSKPLDYMKELCDFYNEAAQNCAKYDCKVGFQTNGTREFKTIMPDGKTTYWDYFFDHTDNDVQMKLDVGFATMAGEDPAEFYKKHPGRSFSLYASERGNYNSVLGGVSNEPVMWDKLLPVTKNDGVQWYIVESTRHKYVLSVAKQSFNFLHSKGLSSK